jgi:acyl-CoA dehydrogenase
MAAPADLAWPFFDDGHRALVPAFERWAADELPALLHGAEDSLDAVHACVARLVRSLGRAGLLRVCVPAACGGWREQLDVRSLALGREVLARASGLADFALAMQGLGSAPVTLFGSSAQQQRLLPGVADGSTITAFALSEPDAGSDVAAMSTTATRLPGGGWRLDGCKTWISNAGLADHYVVFARSGEAPGARGISAFMVPAPRRGWTPASASPSSRHTRWARCAWPTAAWATTRCWAKPGRASRSPWARSTASAPRWARPGWALRAAPWTRRRSVRAAAACSAARWPTSSSRRRSWARWRWPSTRRRCWCTAPPGPRTCSAVRVTREASMAKLYATEAAQQVIDGAVQLFGGLGVVQGVTVERLYREIRALRIYEGASEVLELIIGGRVLEDAAQGARP